MDYIDGRLSEQCEDGRDCEFDEAEESHEQALKRAELEAYREAAKIFGDALNKYALFILNSKDPRAATYVMAYALQLACVRELTMQEIGNACGFKTRQSIDAEVQKFCTANGYKPAPAMKSEASSKSYKHARIMSILENQEA